MRCHRLRSGLLCVAGGASDASAASADEGPYLGGDDNGPEGHGLLTFVNGDVFEGTFSHGFIGSGDGALCKHNGTTYRGFFHKGFCSGKRILKASGVTEGSFGAVSSSVTVMRE